MKKTFLCLVLLSALLFSGSSVSAAQIFLSQNKPYGLMTPASAGYPDDGKKLTDGRFGTPVPTGTRSFYYRDPAYVGFRIENADENGNFVILLDLGERFSDLSSFALGYLNEPDAGIFAPLAVTFEISDGETGHFTTLGTVSLSEPTAKGCHTADLAVFIPEAPVSARFVRCVITPRTGYGDNGKTVPTRWTFVDELVVLQGKTAVWEERE